MANGIDELDDKVFNLIEGGDALNLFEVGASEEINQNFVRFKDNWNNPSFREGYEEVKQGLVFEPRRYVGHLEDYPEMYKDIKLAADETGVDPNFLYNVGMFEGMARDKTSWYEEENEHGFPRQVEEKGFKYDSDFWEDSYRDIGLDILINEMPNLVDKGYLDTPLKMLGDTTKTSLNEKGAEVTHALIKSKDAWRGVGGLLRLKEEEMVNVFNNRGLDFSDLTKKQKEFWIYASFNAGPGNASKLLDTYGPSPLENEEILRRVTGPKEMKRIKTEEGWIEVPLTQFDKAKQASQLDSEEWREHSLKFWMQNIGAVSGGTELTRTANPFFTE